jgi:hypothetical protein
VSAHLIFVGVFLGIVTGRQGVALQADADIKSIRLTLGGKQLALLTKPPWQAEVDFGIEIVPRELAAIGLDANGNEIARVTQVLNVPRPTADVQIVRDGDGLRLTYSNIQYSPPRKTTVTFDTTKLKVGSDLKVTLPRNIDWSHPHVVQAEMRFDDGVIARREAVLESTRFSDTAESELTPVALMETSTVHPATFDGCFTIDGQPVPASAVEKESAHVVFVQDPDPRTTISALDPTHRSQSVFTRSEMARLAHLDDDTLQALLWPVAKQFVDSSTRSVSRLFEHSQEMQPKGGLIGLLTTRWPPSFDTPRQYVDAVAVAGIRSAGGTRRAVVLIFNDQPDVSRLDPGAVRRYLAALGVPFFVWSPTAVPIEVSTRWGEIQDISTVDHLRAATARLRATLASQRIAWIHADPLSAIRVKADERCGFKTINE